MLNSFNGLWIFGLLIWLLLGLPLHVSARTAVAISEVWTSHHAGTDAELKKIIDGKTGSPTGWSLGEKLNTPQAAIFTLAEAVEADLLELSLFFMSGRPHASFSDFSLSFTTDDAPALKSHWTPVPPINFSATTCTLKIGPGTRLVAEETSPIVTGGIPDDIYRISTRLLGKSVTGFKIEVFPVKRSY